MCMHACPLAYPSVVCSTAPAQCSLWVGVPYTESASQLKMKFSCAPCKLDSICRACARVCHKYVGCGKDAWAMRPFGVV